MRYIIMCGNISQDAKTSRHLTMINGEPIVCRTIRLLHDAGVDDIAISTNTHLFDSIEDADIIYMTQPQKHWVDGFYLTAVPTCYIFGDVVFSKQAIRTIVETETDDIEFFASAPPYAIDYAKGYAEPFAFKVNNVDYFAESIQRTKNLTGLGMFKRYPIAWELWQVIKETEFNKIDYTNYTVINDYTCDVDCEADVEKIARRVPRYS